MIRWFLVALMTGCMAAQVAGTPAQNQEAAQPGTALPSTSPAASPSTTASTGRFPFDAFQDFSAIMVGSLLTGDDREAHIYRSGDLLRTQGTEGLGYYLTDLSSFETYGITKLGCRSDSHPYFRAFPFSASRPNRKIERVSTGKESLDGRMCQVEEVTISGGDLALPIKLKFWEAEDLQGFPIKVEILGHRDARSFQYKNVVLGPGDPTLFIRPKQCLDKLPEPPVKNPAVKKKQAAPSADKSKP